MFPRKNRIDKKLFPEFIKKAKTFSSENLNLKVTYGCPKDRAFAFVASLKVSKKAAERNKLKRRARAITYPLLKDVSAGICAAVFFKPSIFGKKYGEIKDELISLYKKAKII
ncbi:MAG: Ribonuclease P protein component [Parcubacteria group bacterium GW2011_GWB1_43_8]|nr:MAG: Ribonuclease P protein component [Parcubacteria group bacterium GW2011_GWB1_43_8]